MIMGRQFGIHSAIHLIASNLLELLRFNDSTNRYHVKAPPEPPATLTDAATIAIDASAAKSFRLAFTAAVGNSRTISNPTNLENSQTYMFILVQDAIGSRTVSWGDKFNFSGGSAPILTTTGNKRDILLFRYDATADKLDHLATQGNL